VIERRLHGDDTTGGVPDEHGTLDPDAVENVYEVRR
jgi:hypothetical protein